MAELSADEGLRLLRDELDTVVLDCDGVLWRGNQLIDKSVEALEVVRSMGKRVLFLTNNASKSRQQYKAKFDSLGIDVSPAEIVPASYCAAAYLRSIGFPADKRVFLIGTNGVEEELREAGISFVGGTDTDFVPRTQTGEDVAAVQVDSSIGAVVVGFDPNFDYARLVYASICLREIPGCHFVVTNGDHADRVASDRLMPVTGSIAASIERASGRLPVVVGKGGAWLLPWLCERYGLDDPARACIVGDRLDTDIALGKEGGLQTFLPMTGVTQPEDLDGAELDGTAPDYWMPSIATLAGLQ